MKKHTIVQILRIIIAVLFIFSAISKILSLPFFDGLVAKLLIGKNYYEEPGAFLFVQLFTRLIIAGEMLLGVAILQSKYLKSIVLPTIFGILLLFTGHLFYEGFTDKFIGGNCGCFGDLVPLDNLNSIYKNVIAMAMVIFIWKNYHRRNEMRFRSWVFPVVVGSVSLATLLLTVEYRKHNNEVKDFSNFTAYEEINDSINQAVEPNEDTVTTAVETTPNPDPKKEEKQPETAPKAAPKTATVKEKKPEKPTTIFSGYTEFQNEGKGVDLDKGRKMICMFSLTCGHCQEAYKDICAMADQGGFPPIYLLLYGDSEDQITYFFNQAGCKHPYIFIKDYLEFERLLQGDDFPRILDRKEGKNQKIWNLDTYTKESLAEYFGLELPKEESNGFDFLD